MDLHQEIDAFRRKHGVEGRFAMKKVMRKYAFELEDVPHGESEWYKVVYGYDRKLVTSLIHREHRVADRSTIVEPQLPLDSCGATFSKIFGTNTSAFEMLVVKRKIMGPCWLEIKGCLKTGSKPVSNKFFFAQAAI
jgi:DNA polymerase alpha subunit A